MKSRPITNWDQVPIIMDIPMVARILGYHPERIRQLIKLNKIPAYKIGQSWRIEKQDLIDYLHSGRNGYSEYCREAVK